MLIIAAIFLAIIAALILFFSGKFVIVNLMAGVDGFFEGLFGKDSALNTYWPFIGVAIILMGITVVDFFS